MDTFFQSIDQECSEISKIVVITVPQPYDSPMPLSCCSSTVNKPQLEKSNKFEFLYKQYFELCDDCYRVKSVDGEA